MANELQEVLNDIKEDKLAYLIPQNIKSGVKILGVTGNAAIANNQLKRITENGIYTPDTDLGYTGFGEIDVEVASLDTTDATASADDISLNKTAYVNGEKITGTAPEIDYTYETITNTVQTISLKNINSRLICVTNGYSIILQNKVLKVTKLSDDTSTEIDCTLTGDYLAVDAGCIDYFGKNTIIIVVCSGSSGYIYLFNGISMTIEQKGNFSSSALSVNGVYFPAVNPHRPYVSLSLGLYGSAWGAPGSTICKINNDFTLTIARKVSYLDKSGSSAIYVQMDRWLNDYIFDIVNDSGYSSSSLGGDIYIRDAGINTKYFLEDETLADPVNAKYLMTANSANTYVCYYSKVDSNYIYSIKKMNIDGSGTINIGDAVCSVSLTTKVFARFLTDDIILIGNKIYRLQNDNLIEMQEIVGTINHINRYNSLILNENTLNWFLTEGTTRLVSANYNNSKILNNTDDATALINHILLGKTAYTISGKVTGSMENHEAMTFLPTTLNQSIPSGYHNGNGVVKGDSNLIAENIKKDITIFNIKGTFESNIEDLDDYAICNDLAGQILGELPITNNPYVTVEDINILDVTDSNITIEDTTLVIEEDINE